MLPFTFAGLVVASVIYSMPFVVQPLQQAFAAIGAQPMEAAATLRASPLDAFLTVALPLARPGFIAVFALDRKVLGESTENATRRLQLSLNLGAAPAEATFATWDAPLSPLEQRLLASLEPLAGDTPRARKRLRNLYRFLRPPFDAPDDLAPALAFMLAVDLGATPSELRAMAGAARNGDDQLHLPETPRLNEYVNLARGICGPIKTATALWAVQLASVVSLR